jgi:lysophospholipase L1-like esterase
MLLMSVNHRKRRKKIVFFGDSITEQGLRIGGYIRVLRDLLYEAAIDDDYELVGAGVSGDKVYDLYLRMDEDILSKGADLVVIFIGINDVGHKWSLGTGTDISSFEAFYVAIIEKLLAAGIKVVLCTPGLIGEAVQFENKEDVEIERYCGLIRDIAVKYQLPLVDIRKAFVEYNRAYNMDNKSMGVLTTDRVHLNIQGNQLVAKVMWPVLQQFMGL